MMRLRMEWSGRLIASHIPHYAAATPTPPLVFIDYAITIDYASHLLMPRNSD